MATLYRKNGRLSRRRRRFGDENETFEKSCGVGDGLSRRLADFSVADGVVRGRVEVGKVASGVETQGALGANARVVLLGAASLDGGFAELGGAAVAEDGAFRFDLGGAAARFFKVRIDAENVVE